MNVKTVTLNTKYIKNVTGDIDTRTYQDGSLAVALVEPNGYEYMLLSVNIKGYGITPAKDCFFVKDYSEHQGLAEALENTGFFKITKHMQLGQYNALFKEVQFV